MSVKLKNINPLDYEMLLSRVNTSICQFNNTTDQMEQARQFIAKVDEISTSRSSFFDNIEKRLSKLLDPNANLINWFISKRSTLEVVLSKIKTRQEADPNYLSRYSAEFGEGINLTEKLLALGDEDISSLHIGDILKIKKALLELKSTTSGESSNNSKAVALTQSTSDAEAATNNTAVVVTPKVPTVPTVPAKPVFAEDFFYLYLHEIHNLLTLYFRDDVTTTIRLDVEFYGWYQNLRSWNDKFKEDLTTAERIKNGFPKRIKIILSLLSQLAAAAKQSRVDEAISSGGESETQNTTVSMDIAAGAPSPHIVGISMASPASSTVANMNKYYPIDQLTSFYLIVQDLMRSEWKRLQNLTPSIDNTTLNNKRRKINDDNSVKSKLVGSKAQNKLDTTIDNESERMKQLVSSWNNGNPNSSYDSLLFGDGVNHFSGLILTSAL